MFSKKKPAKSKPQSRSGRSGNLSQYGLFDIPNLDNPGVDDVENDDDDDELEAELLAITGESNKHIRQKPKQGPIVIPATDLDLMVAASLKDIPSDESVSGDDDDPDLLDELNAISGEPVEKDAPTAPTHNAQTGTSQVALLMERLSMYQQAEVNAKAAGETARARRFSRGIKTLNDLVKQASAGKPVSEDEIPPPVSVQKSEPKPATAVANSEGPQPPLPIQPSPIDEPANPLRPAPLPPVPPRGARTGVALPGLTSQTSFPETPTSPPPQVSSDEPTPTSPAPADVPSSPKRVCSEVTSDSDSEKAQTLSLLVGRQDEYKHAALAAKKSGDTATAISYIKIAKQFDTVIAAVEANQPVDLSAMPPSLSATASAPHQGPPPLTHAEKQQSGAPEDGASSTGVTISPPEQESELPEEFVVEMPSSVMEALEQRMTKYKSQEEAAKTEGNSSKARRMGRIVKQYADAIKLHKAGKPFAVEDLPTPPGYPPIPVEGSAKPPPSPRPATHAPALPTLSPVPVPAPTVPQPSPHTPQPVPPQASTSSDLSPEKQNVRKMGGSHQERQLQEILEKQKQFKLAAMQAKKKGEVNQAKEYLRIAKGFDKLIEASNCGLPVDMSTLPVPPSSKVALETDFDIVSAEDCTPASPGSEDDILEKLEKDLIEQMKIESCLSHGSRNKLFG